MQFFERDGKFNWIDENNVVLGYDSESSCCEYAGWFLSEAVTGEDRSEAPATEIDWADWRFDPDFFKEVDPVEQWTDDGGIAVFRIVNGERAMYLHLFNSHNGYYGHGFDFEAGNIKREGCL